MSEPRTPEVERERATPKVLPRDETSTSWRRFGAPRAAQPGASRRRDPRVPAPFEVSTSTIDPVTDGITGQTCFHASDDGVVNLSRRGACLISDTPPSVGTRTPIQLHFPESLDYALLHRVIEVRDFHDALIAGRVEVGDEEKRWSFVPDLPWSKEEYSLSIDPILEDLAGNTPVRVFETDLRDKPLAAPQLTRRFHPH